MVAPDPALTRGGVEACVGPSVTGMSFTVVDWNVNGFATKAQPEFLGALEWDIAFLQEVTTGSWEEFRDLGDAGGVAFGHLPPLAGTGPRYACAILARGTARLEDFRVLRDVPSPERAAVATVTIGGRHAQVCSWAAPPGVTWGRAGKGRQVERFAAFLRDRPGPMLVGIDRNAPKWERQQLADDEWWNTREPLLYGPDRVHDLRDAYRDYLEAHPALASQIQTERPDGPLAVTHCRGGIDCQYDAIYASPEFAVEEVEHRWDQARAAGSDHAPSARHPPLALTPLPSPRWIVAHCDNQLDQNFWFLR